MPRGFFCTALYDRQVAWLSGPYKSHAEALADVPRVLKGLALASGDPRADFAAYGTARFEGVKLPPVKFPIRTQ